MAAIAAVTAAGALAVAAEVRGVADGRRVGTGREAAVFTTFTTAFGLFATDEALTTGAAFLVRAAVFAAVATGRDGRAARLAVVFLEELA